MTDYGTIKIPAEDYERHNERRKEMGLSWAAYIDKQAPDPPQIDYAQIANHVANELEGRMR